MSEMLLHHLVLGQALARFSSQHNLLWQYFSGKFWSQDRTNIAEISLFGEVARHSGLYAFHSCAICCEVARHELFAKISSLQLVLEIAHFQSYPRSMSICESEDRNKVRFKNWQHCGVWKLPFGDHRAMKLSQKCACFANSWINLLVPSTVTREWHTKGRELSRHGTAYAAYIFSVTWVSEEKQYLGIFWSHAAHSLYKRN